MEPRRPTLGEQAYEELQEQIVSGRLPQASGCSPTSWPDRSPTSPTPVKEALARLELDGLVEGEGAAWLDGPPLQPRRHRGDLRARMLSGAARGRASAWPAAAPTPRFVARLRALFDEQMRFVERRRRDALPEAIRLDRAFHELIVGLGQNRLIAGWHRMVLRQTQTMRNYSLAHYDVTPAAEHGAIVDAFAAGDAASVVDALRAHLTASRDEFLSRPPEELPKLPVRR